MDREKRHLAASLIQQFLACELTNNQFEDAFFPLVHNPDRAFKAIGTAIWCCYDDTREHVLNDGCELPSELLEFFQRCILFLHTDSPYQWERASFIGLRWTQPVCRLVSKFFLKHRQKKAASLGLRLGPELEEDWRVWPFSSHEDLVQAKEHAEQFPS